MASGPQSLDAKFVALRVGECTDQDEKVGDALAENFRTLLFDASLGSQQKIARLGQRCDERGGAHAVEFLCSEKHSCVARDEPESSACGDPCSRDFAGMPVQRTKVGEELFGASEGFFFRPVDPAKA